MKSKIEKRHGSVMGEAEYRNGAISRIGEASTLLRSAQFAGCIYLSGRAVEGALRALLWKFDEGIKEGRKSLDTGHNLRKLLTSVQNLGLLSTGGRGDPMIENVQHVARLWHNNMRFVSEKAVETGWVALHEVRKGHTFKQAAETFFNACSAIVKRCEALCQKQK